MELKKQTITKPLLVLVFIGQFFILSTTVAETAVAEEAIKEENLIQQCDKLTANEFDPARKAPAVLFDNINTKDALFACRRALDVSPYEARLQYQYARALMKSDDSTTIDWYKKAAKQNYVAAVYQLGNLYSEGKFVKEDKKEALKWYKKASALGDPYATANVGLMYYNGTGTNKDIKEALKWYKKASALGNPVATSNVGAMYYSGNGVNKNLKEALKWFLQAAEAGNPRAQFSVGLFYKKGIAGLEINKPKAVEWYKKSAKQDNVTAQYWLAEMYYVGDGINKNYSEAYKWYAKAAKHGDKKSIAKIKTNFKYAELPTVRAWVNDNDPLLTPNVQVMDFLQRYAAELKKGLLSTYTCNIFKDKIDMFANSNYPDRTRQLQIDKMAASAIDAGCSAY